MSILKQYHYLYKITNLINNKIYIGIRSTNNLDDGYFGSGVALNKSIEKHGKENFTKEILEWFDWRCELANRENQIVDVEFIKRPDTYNTAIGGIGGAINLGKHWSEETKLKQSLSKLGTICTEETKKKLSDSHSGINNSFYGKIHTDETKLLISEKQLDRWKDSNYKEMMLKIYNAPEYKEMVSTRTKAKWVDHTYREKTIKALKDSYTQERKDLVGKRAKLLWQNPEYRSKITGECKSCSIYGEIFSSIVAGFNKFKESNPKYAATLHSFRRQLRTNKIKDCFVLDINKV